MRPSLLGQGPAADFSQNIDPGNQPARFWIEPSRLCEDNRQRSVRGRPVRKGRRCV